MEGGLHSAAAYSAFEDAIYGSCVANANSCSAPCLNKGSFRAGTSLGGSFVSTTSVRTSSATDSTGFSTSAARDDGRDWPSAGRARTVAVRRFALAAFGCTGFWTFSTGSSARMPIQTNAAIASARQHETQIHRRLPSGRCRTTPERLLTPLVVLLGTAFLTPTSYSSGRVTISCPPTRLRVSSIGK